LKSWVIREESNGSTIYVYGKNAKEKGPSPAVAKGFLLEDLQKELKKFIATQWKPAAFGGTMSIIGYSMVVYAFTLAPVGYVATMRESSVVIAALAGWKYLKEDDHKRRLTSAIVVVLGLVVLVAGR
jgi:drug/metabolite transporter (DMT)-like permease